jgi:hypothetical protein
MATFEVTARPIFDNDDGGLTARQGPVCAHTKGDRLAEVMQVAGVKIEEWVEASPDDAELDPIAFDVRVVVN